MRVTLTVSARTHSDDIFLYLAEQLKVPLLQIAHAAELLGDTSQIEQSQLEIKTVSEAALQLIEGYLLQLELQRDSSLGLEPVSLSSVLHDTAHALSGFAQVHGCTLELSVHGRYVPVMANRRAVQAALTALGLSFIETAVSVGANRPVVELSVRRTPTGINAGIFSAQAEVRGNLMKEAHRLRGSARQPIPNFTGNTAGVFVADSLFGLMNSRLKFSTHHGLYGLAATLMPSRQLSLV